MVFVFKGYFPNVSCHSNINVLLKHIFYSQKLKMSLESSTFTVLVYRIGTALNRSMLGSQMEVKTFPIFGCNLQHG